MLKLRRRNGDPVVNVEEMSEAVFNKLKELPEENCVQNEVECVNWGCLNEEGTDKMIFDQNWK